MKSRPDGQLSVGPMELRSSEQDASLFRKSELGQGGAPMLGNSEQQNTAFRNSEHPDGLASALFDEALKSASIENKEVAHLCGVSVSLVEKWRKPAERGCPSFTQMLRLPPAFHIELHRAMNRRFGYGRAAIAQILEGLGTLAVVNE